MKNLIFTCLIILFFSCKKESEIRKYSYGTFPSTPVNIEVMNSEYDDYNSTLANVGRIFPLCYSTNRNSQGADFDIIYKLVSFQFSLIDGGITVVEFNETNTSGYAENYTINYALPKINTSSDEFGPYLINKTYQVGSTLYPKNYTGYILMYSDNSDGNQDIKYLHNLNSEEFNQPKPLTYLNSLYDDAYPTVNSDSSRIYFCSNRAGNFDIFYAELNNENSLLENLEGTTPKNILKDTLLSSGFDDKCPFILGETMVFTSNRPGGFGGFDLYYSKFENGKWSEPINFGSDINTSYDEYRPIVKSMWDADFSNDLMIFSSNRPGGKGGFDLYYVGVEHIDVFHY